MCTLNMTHSSCRITLFFISTSVALVLCAQTAYSDTPPRPSRMVMGIVPFSYHATEKDFVEVLLPGRLRKYDIVAKMLVKDGKSPQELFSEREELDFIIEGSVTGQGKSCLAIAHIHERGKSKSQDLELRGETAGIDLTAAIIEYVASNSAIGSLVNERRQGAQEKLRDDPDDFDSLMILGLATAGDSAWSRAIDYFRRALAVNRDDAQVHYNLAICYKNIGDKSKELLHLRTVLELDRDNESASIAIGNHFLEIGQYGKALGEYEKWLESPKNSSLVHWNLAVLHVRRGKLDLAQTQLDSIPATSFYFAEARAWSDSLQQKNDRSITPNPTDGARQSVFERLGLPTGFGTVLLVISLVVLLSPYLSGQRLGNIEIPRFSLKTQGTLKILGPMIFLLCIALFIPLLGKAPLESSYPTLVAGDQKSFDRYFHPPATDR